VKSCWITLLFFFAMASTASAQQPLITPETPVNSDMLRQLLHSGDPLLIAWTADFTRRTHDAASISEMPTLLENYILMNGCA
jgi:hypothetical protein